MKGISFTFVFESKKATLKKVARVLYVAVSDSTNRI